MERLFFNQTMTIQEIANKPVTAFYFGEKQGYLQSAYEAITGEKVQCTMCDIRKMHSFVKNYYEGTLIQNNDMKNYKIVSKFLGAKIAFGGKVLVLSEPVTQEMADLAIASGNGFMLRELPAAVQPEPIQATAKEIAVPENETIANEINEPTNEAIEPQAENKLAKRRKK